MAKVVWEWPIWRGCDHKARQSYGDYENPAVNTRSVVAIWVRGCRMSGNPPTVLRPGQSWYAENRHNPDNRWVTWWDDEDKKV